MKKLTYSAFSIVLVAFMVVGCGDDQPATDPDMTMDDDTVVTGADPTGMEGMTMDGDTLFATLSGDTVPDGGDPDGSGTAEVVLNSADGTVCFTLQVENIAEAGAAHIHSGAAGTAGPPVIDFNVPENGLSGCADSDAEIIDQVLTSPSEYYVNVHNEEYGGGAVRGQLEQRSGM